MSAIQSVVFPKQKFKQEDAVKWLKSNKLKHNDIDEQTNTIRFRQFKPLQGDDITTRTHKLKNGVLLILQYDKPQITISKANDGKHKYEARILYKDTNKTVKFGARGYDDYTTHKDKERLQRYVQRHSNEKKFWKMEYDNLSTASFWSRFLLWNEHVDPDIQKAANWIEQKMDCKIKLNF